MADTFQTETVSSPDVVFDSDDIGGTHIPILKLTFGALDASVLAIAGAGAVTAGTQRVTLASDDPAVVDLAAIEVLLTTMDAVLDTIKVDTEAIETAVELIDDAIFVDDTATHSTGTTKLMGVGAVAVPTDTAISANDIGMLAMSLDRRLLVDADITASVALDVSAATVTVDLGANNDVTIDGSSIVRAEDVGHSGGDTGVMALAIRDDALAANAGVNADLDYVPLRTNNDGALWTQISAGNLGGCKMFNDIDLDQADIDVATGPCTVYAIHVINTTTGIIHLKLFNTNTVTMGTTNATASLAIPGNADSDGAGFVLPIPACGVAFSTALTVAVAGASALDDNSDPAAGAALATIFYHD